MASTSVSERLRAEIVARVNDALIHRVDPDVLEQVATSIYGRPEPLTGGHPLATHVSPPGIDAIANAVRTAILDALHARRPGADA